MQIGELVAVIVDMEGPHDSTCPWHEEPKQDSGSLTKPDLEEDVDQLQENDGGVLGSNMKPSKYPSDMVVEVSFTQTGTADVTVKKKGVTKIKKLALYDPSAPKDYDVVFAAHHLVPGNEAFKGHPIVAWAGADGKIAEGKRDGGPSSKIIDGQFIGYDINNRDNGIWLPGPYALSTSGGWPSAADMTSAKLGAGAKGNNVNFKKAYAFAVIDGVPVAASSFTDAEKDYLGQQFHFRHDTYSNFAEQCLTKMDEKLRAIAQAPCDEAKPAPSGKYNAPYGLLARLNGLSRRIAPYLRGKPWSKFIYTDELSSQYITDRKLDI